MNETEIKVIELLVNHETTSDGFAEPIFAVDKAMGWATADTLKFVRDLMSRQLVQLVPIVSDGLGYSSRCRWRRPSASN